MKWLPVVLTISICTVCSALTLPTGDVISDAAIEYTQYYEQSQNIKKIIFKHPVKVTVLSSKVKVMYIGFYEDGNIEECRLSEDVEIKSHIGVINVMYRLLFYPNGTLSGCSLNTAKKVTTSAGQVIISDRVLFYDNGRIKECIIDDSEINSPSGNFTVYDELRFHDNGSLSVCRLKSDTVIEDDTYEADSIIGWDTGGNFLGIMQWDYSQDKYISEGN